MNAIFIRLDYNLNDVMSYRQGKYMTHFNFSGVRLLPNKDYPYIQRTDTPTGMVLDNPTVEVMSMCGEVIQDITDSFTVVSTFEDGDTGLTQIYWSLTNIPDFGQRLIYLRINNGSDAYVYSSPFMIYGVEEGEVPPYTFHYRADDLDEMQSIGVELYYSRDAEIFEQESYVTVGGNKQISLNSQLLEYEVGITTVIDYKLLRLLKRMFCFTETYCDFKQVRLIKPFDTPEFTGNENFVQVEVEMQLDSSITYDPFYVPPAPPPPPDREIVLNKVEPFAVIGMGANSSRVAYYFDLINLPANYLIYQYSVDEINWTDSPPQAAVSLQPVTVPNYQTIGYVYRIYSPEYDIYSNTTKIQEPSVVITNVYSPDTAYKPLGGNIYYIEYVNYNFTPSGQLTFEASPNGTDWFYGSSVLFPQGTGNQNPKILQITSSGIYFKYFRIRYTPINITSNTFFFEF